jgi:hypothetical protein
MSIAFSQSDALSTLKSTNGVNNSALWELLTPDAVKISFILIFNAFVSTIGAQIASRWRGPHTFRLTQKNVQQKGSWRVQASWARDAQARKRVRYFFVLYLPM